MFGIFKKRSPSPPPVSPLVDLKWLTCDDMTIDQSVPTSSSYLPYFLDDTEEKGTQIYKNSPSGLEITTRDGLVDSIFISLNSFTGRFSLGGEPLDLTLKTTESRAAAVLGEPWWKHVDSDLEVIDFHERNDGVEIQLEYPALCDLRFITILRTAILSDAEQREAYGVTKPWPPADTY